MNTKVLLALFLAVLCLFDATSVLAYSATSVLQNPLTSYVVGTNNFGAYNKIGNDKWHLGDDVTGSAGTSVFAIGNGIVRRAQIQTGYGGMYIIEHNVNGEKICALYTHLNFNTFSKSVGSEVLKGEYLGEIGDSSQNGGWAPHLHFSIRKGEYPIDPNAYIYGDWIFSGYTSNESVLNDWHNPSQFIESHQSPPITAHWSSGDRHEAIYAKWQSLVDSGNNIGEPFDNTGGTLADGLYVHNWFSVDGTESVTLQDFSNGQDEYFAIIDNPALGQAFLLKGGFRWHYMASADSPKELGAPIEDEGIHLYFPRVGAGFDYTADPDVIYIKQEFENGKMLLWNGGSDVYVESTSGSGGGVVIATLPGNGNTLTFLPYALSSTKVQLNWSAISGAVWYEAFQDGISVGVYDGLEASIDDLQPETAYSFRIEANDGAGNLLSVSETIVVTTLSVAVPPEPEVPEDPTIAEVTVMSKPDNLVPNTQYQVVFGLESLISEQMTNIVLYDVALSNEEWLSVDSATTPSATLVGHGNAVASVVTFATGADYFASGTVAIAIAITFDTPYGSYTRSVAADMSVEPFSNMRVSILEEYVVIDEDGQSYPTFQVSNVSNQPSVPCRLEIDVDYSLVTSVLIPELSAGMGWTAELPIGILSAGTYFIAATIDTDGVITEVNEFDNIDFADLEVLTEPPPLPSAPFAEDFESFALGGLTDPGWTENTAGICQIVDQDGKCLSLGWDPNSSSAWHDINNFDQGVIYYRVRNGSVGNNYTLVFGYNSDLPLFGLEQKPNGMWAVYSNTGWHDIGNYNEDQWYSAGIKFDCNTSTYFVSIDESGWLGPYGFVTQAAVVDAMRINDYCYNGQPNFYDDFYVGPEEEAPDTTDPEDPPVDPSQAIFFEDFESGQLPTDWLFNGTYSVSNQELLATPSPSSDSAWRIFDPITHGTVNYRVKLSSTSNYELVYIYEKFDVDSSAAVHFNKYGSLEVRDNTGWSMFGSYQANQWYDVSLQFTCIPNNYQGLAAQTFRVSVDGQWYGPFGFWTPALSIDRIRINSYSPNGSSNFYDDFQLDQLE